MKLADLFIKLGLKKDGFDKGIDGAKKKTNAFAGSIKKIGGLMAGAFAVGQVVAFGKELLEIGGIAEGVENAFLRMADANTLKDLQKATAGTVSELELMKRAVSAKNLGVPMENLASLFEFATKRAQDTGESVDYLVNSIVTGIGRKSPLILDNLGISAINLREKLKGVGLESASVADVAAAVGDIAADSMRESGKVIDTNAIKLQKLGAQWENFKKQIATDKGVTTFFSVVLNEAKELLDFISTGKYAHEIEAQRKAEEKAAEQRKKDTEAQIAINNLFGKSINDLTDAEIEAAIKSSEANNKAYEARKKAGKTIGELRAETDALTKSLDDYGVNQRAEIQNTLRQIDANKKLIKELTTLNRTSSEAAPSGMTSIGTPDFSTAISTPKSLQGIDDFIAEIREKYANLIDQQTMDRMVSRFEMTEQLISDLNMTMIGGISDMVTDISAALGEAFAGGEWDNFGQAILQAIGGFMQQLGALLIAYAIAMALFDASTKAGPMGWPLALAAGIALVAAGAAISSLMSGGAGGGGGGASGYSPSASTASTAISGNVNFVLEGDKLVGAINNNNSRKRITG